MTSPIQPGQQIKSNAALSSGWHWALLIVLPLAVIYLALPLQNYTDAKDALSYAVRVRAGEPIFHANHLLYEPLNFVWNRLVSAIFGATDALRSAQLLSTLTAVPALYLMCRIAQRWDGAVLPGAIAVCAIGFSFGVWCYSISPDGYLPPLFFVFVAIALLDPARWSRSGSNTPKLALFVAAALVTAAAVLLHQMYVFFAIAMGVLILVSPEFGHPVQRIRSFLVYAGISGCIVLVTYVAVFAALVTDESFLDWVRGYASKGLYYNKPPSLLTPLLGAVGAVTSMLSMNALVGFDAVASAAQRWFPGYSLFEERFLAEQAIGKPLAVVVLVAMTVSVFAWLAFAWLAVSTSMARKRNGIALPFVDRLLLALTVMYTVLVLIWEPINREFWIHIYVFATLLCAMAVNFRRRSVTALATVLCLSLFIANFFGAVRPLATSESDFWRVFHRQEFTGIDVHKYDAVLISCNYLCFNYIRYFHVPNIIVPDLKNPDMFVSHLSLYPPEKVLVSRWFFTPHSSVLDPLTRLPVGPEAYSAILNRFRAAYPSAVVPEAPHSKFYRFDAGRLVPVDGGSP